MMRAGGGQVLPCAIRGRVMAPPVSKKRPWRAYRSAEPPAGGQPARLAGTSWHYNHARRRSCPTARISCVLAIFDRPFSVESRCLLPRLGAPASRPVPLVAPRHRGAAFAPECETYLARQFGERSPTPDCRLRLLDILARLPPRCF
jgi:hypothetical protein